MALTAKQERFINEYLIDLNASAAAIRAGYSPKYADRMGYKLVENSRVKEAIKEKMQSKDDETIAKQDEVLRYLTSVLRGEIEEECIIVEGQGDGYSRASVEHKQVSPKDRNKAAELLGKRYSLFTDKIEHSGETGVKIINDIPRNRG